jgi:hypothetical protein
MWPTPVHGKYQFINPKQLKKHFHMVCYFIYNYPNVHAAAELSNFREGWLKELCIYDAITRYVNWVIMMCVGGSNRE